ncbi:MAG: hypothetical protein VW235_14250, partial [Rhodospirillaceae bacterium]
MKFPSIICPIRKIATTASNGSQLPNCKNAKIFEKTWNIHKAKFLSDDKFEEIENYKFESQIDLTKLKNFFDNADI